MNNFAVRNRLKILLTNRLFFFLIVGIAFIGVVYSLRSSTSTAYRLIIKNMSGQREISVNLKTEMTLEIEGPLGKTMVHIHQGKVWVSESPCPDKTCIKMGKIPDNGGFIACLPNKVILRALFNK